MLASGASMRLTRMLDATSTPVLIWALITHGTPQKITTT